MLELKQTPKYHKNSIPINRVSVAVPLLDRWTVYLGGTPGSGVTKSYDSREQTAPDLCSSGGVECTAWVPGRGRCRASQVHVWGREAGDGVHPHDLPTSTPGACPAGSMRQRPRVLLSNVTMSMVSSLTLHVYLLSLVITQKPQVTPL